MSEANKVGRPYYLLIENTTNDNQTVKLFSDDIPDGVIISSIPPYSYNQLLQDIVKYPCIIGLLRIESTIALDGESFFEYHHLQAAEKKYVIENGRHFKNDTNVWEYWCKILLDDESCLSFVIKPDSKLRVMLFPSAEPSHFRE